MCLSNGRPFQRGIMPEDDSTHLGEYLHYSDPATGKVAVAPPVLRRELRGTRNDAIYGELSRFMRNYATFRPDEFHNPGNPPSAVAFHYGKNPRHLKHDGAHAIDHDREDVATTLRKDAWDSCAAYTHKVA